MSTSIAEEMKFHVGDSVRIFENVTGNKYGESGTVEQCIEDERAYLVGAVDGSLFKSPEDQTE